MKYHTLTSHQLESIATCPRFAQFDLIMEITPVGTKMKLERGELVHKFLEYHYLEKMHGQYDHKLTLDRVINQSSAYALAELHLDSEIVQECVDRYKGYYEYWKGEDWIVQSVEEKFSKLIYVVEDQEIDGVLVEGFTLLYEGRKDLVVTSHKLAQAGRIVVDHKTGDQNNALNKRANQFFGYCWSEPATFMVINRILFVKDENNWFHRPFINYNAEAINEWRHSVGWWFSQYLSWKESGIYAPNYGSCSRYGTCTFQDICDTTVDNREWKIESAYRVKEPIDYFGRR